MKNVYDIALVGPHNRFTILTSRGPLIVHNCGYQMGEGKFNDYCLNNGTDLSKYGIDAADVVAAWREKHSPIVQMWWALQRAFIKAAQGRASQVSYFQFEPSADGKDVAIFLPSGRPIIYNGVELHPGDKPGRWSISYMSGRYGRVHLYGGKICENVIQAGCRDPLAHAMVVAERDGLDPVLSVHDELVCQVPYCARHEAAAMLRSTMIETALALYPGFPADTDGFTGRRYRK